ncbi:MAG: alpha-glucan family phosphorylase [Patescibacteria group bacterium]|jgi:glucan phosphorylase
MTEQDYQLFQSKPVAYFCTEFALDSKISIYAGGLGVLAGDYIKEAASQNFPLVGVGLYFHEGYLKRQTDPGQKLTPQEKGLRPVLDQSGKLIVVSVPIQDRFVAAQAWEWRENNVSVYLLDSNIPENTPSDRQITNRLYPLDKETRIEQEMLMGIGGFRLLEALGIKPSIYHLNEGHSAFLCLELVKDIMEEQQVDFIKACELAREKIVFTNHTLVAAGNEIFNNDLISAMLAKYAESFKVPVTDMVSLGLVKDSSLFSMTLLSLQLSSKMNAVSAIHDREAAKVWTNHPMEYVTNGIFIPRWDKVQTNDKQQLWAKHQENKRKLLTKIKDVTGEEWDENTLLLGWARRIVPYKRPLAILEDPGTLKRIATKTGREIKLVFAGLCHSEDQEGEQLFQKLQRILNTDLKGIGVFLPGYDLSLAEIMTTGCDVWLNTPVVKSEACGTSGMKAALNGVLPISTKDGWVDEIEMFGVGWLVEDPDLTPSILNTLDQQVAPMYYQHFQNSTDSDWLTHMLNAREMVQNQFSTSRMLKEYIEKMYLPTLTSRSF